jgi:hypothetical protein
VRANPTTLSGRLLRNANERPAHSRGYLYVTSYPEGFSHFVTSMTAPVASDWSGRRVGLAPTGKRRLLTAHANSVATKERDGRRYGLLRRLADEALVDAGNENHLAGHADGRSRWLNSTDC